MNAGLRLLGWFLLLLGLAPLAVTVWVSFSPDSFLTPPTGEWSARWYRRFFADPRWTAAAGRSLFVAAVSAAACVAVALPAAVADGRRDRRRLALLLPAAIPPAALGLGLLPAFHQLGLWGTTAGVVLAHTAVGLPVAYLILRNRIGVTLLDLELAARGLGADRGQVFHRVTLPLLFPSVVAAAVAQFVLSWNEGIVTVFVAGPGSETLPAVMWSQLRGSASPVVAVAAVLSASASVVAVAALAVLAARRFGIGRT